MVGNSLAGMSAEDIDKDVPIPYHYQLRELLRDEIAAGRWEVGERLPSERELCETFNLSRTTVREAIDALVNEGLLQREKGRGTFVAEPKILESLLQTPIGFTDAMLEQGYQVVTKVLRMEIAPAPRIATEELRLKSHEPVIIIDRLRFILNEPILLVTSYVPERICPGLIDEDLAHNSLYHVLRGRCGLTIARAKRFMEAVAANELEATLLNIEPGAPLMLIESTAYSEDGVPIEYFKARHRGDRTRFLVETFKRVIKDDNNS
jgi:GntR family transcriptional regulator